MPAAGYTCSNSMWAALTPWKRINKPRVSSHRTLDCMERCKPWNSQEWSQNISLTPWWLTAVHLINPSWFLSFQVFLPKMMHVQTWFQGNLETASLSIDPIKSTVIQEVDWVFQKTGGSIPGSSIRLWRLPGRWDRESAAHRCTVWMWELFECSSRLEKH